MLWCTFSFWINTHFRPNFKEAPLPQILQALGPTETVSACTGSKWQTTHRASLTNCVWKALLYFQLKGRSCTRLPLVSPCFLPSTHTSHTLAHQFSVRSPTFLLIFPHTIPYRFANTFSYHSFLSCPPRETLTFLTASPWGWRRGRAAGKEQTWEGRIHWVNGYIVSSQWLGVVAVTENMG